MEEKDKNARHLLSTSWTQTFTMTPNEDVENIVFKHKDDKKVENTSKISNIKNVFDINERDSISQLPLFTKHLINDRELDRVSTKDTGIQTFLQGVPMVTIPIEYKNEASQTMYMSNPYPSAKYSQNIMTSMNVSPMPIFKNNRSIQNIITIAPKTSQDEAVKYLSRRRYDEHQEDLQDFIDKETIILEILNFLLSRMFWISDPNLDQIETDCQETQTIIRYNHNTDNIVLDNEVQTKLTCEPKYSNSKLLAVYEETKNFVRSCLHECLAGIESRIIIDDLIEEIIVKGAHILKYPMKEQVIQTVASYKSHEIREEDVLRKLRIPVVVDPFEASIVVVPLIEDLLFSTCNEISRNARNIVKIILDLSIQQAAVIGSKLAEIRKQSQPNSIEQILDRRRKKIVESMLKKETETAGTQTGLAGFPEVGKVKEPKEILCSLSARQSICYWCTETSEDDSLPEQKLPRTQDILLAYNPCYIVATASEEARNPYLQQIDLTKKKKGKLITAQSPISQCVTSKKTDDITKNINILMTSKKNIRARDSVSEWARIMDSTLAKSLSLKDSASNATSVTIMSTTRSASKSCCKRSSQVESIPSLQVTKALQILKSTFCTRDTCTFLTARERHTSDKDANEERMFRNLGSYTLLNLDKRQLRQPINNIDNQICARPRTDKFRVISAQPKF